MVYNKFTYNSALYNAGREEAGALIRSIISAHTGPHIQAAVGGDPSGSPESGAGLAFISDFTIQEGSIKRPPASYFFPDLTARINVVISQVDNLAAFVRGFAFKDLPACVFLVGFQPDLPANIFALAQKDLSAFLFGKLAEKDLPAFIFAAVYNLAGQILGFPAPNLRGRIFVNPPGNLGAIIWSPKDLPAAISVVLLSDISATIRGFGFRDLAGQMLGVPSPTISAFLRGFASQTADIPGNIRLSAEDPNLLADITPSFGGETGFRVGLEGQIASTGGFDSFAAAITSSTPGIENLLASITTGGEGNLSAIIDLLGADNLQGIIGTKAIADTLVNLPSFAQPVIPADIAAILQINANAKLLGASIEALRGSADLGAFLRVAETFVTAIYNIITFGARNLRATIGNPACAGGSATAILGALANPQSAGDISASIQSFIEQNLGAQINTGTTFRAMDFINVSYSKKRNRKIFFRTTDTIEVVYSPFRGTSLAAAITATSPESSLVATITPNFLPPRVAPSVGILTAADLRFGEELNIQQIRLQLEGALTEYFYVNNTQDAFIKDPNQDWKINIRAFKPIAENLFGDFAAARVCRLGDLTAYPTIDAAIRACIAAVIGLEGRRDFNAAITARGGINDLPTTLTVSDLFDNLGAIANRVFPSDFSASITSVGDFDSILAVIIVSAPGTAGIPAVISGFGQIDLGVTFVPNPNAKLMNAFLQVREQLDMSASIVGI